MCTHCTICIYLISYQHYCIFYQQLGSLLVKSIAYYVGGPGFEPRVGNPKFSNDLHQQNLSKPVNRM